MATVSRLPLTLTRNQLASFLKDNEQIRQFEKLIELVNNSPDNFVETFSTGTTGLTPSTPTSGDVVLDGILALLHGGTGANNSDDARINLEAAKSGANTDITSLTGITGAISEVDSITINKVAGVSVVPGQIAWNNNDGTLDIGMGYDNVIQQVGLETYYRIKADSAIANGELVMFTGAVGASGVITGAPSSVGLTEGLRIMGVATMDIAANDFGYVTNFGLVRGIDTTAWNDGDILYYDPHNIGSMTNVRPTSPDEVVIVAAVVNSGPSGSGSLFIRPTFYPNLKELSDVYTPTPTDGDKLVYDGANLRWNNEAFSSVFVSATAPSTPRVGDVWLDTSSGSINVSGSIVTKTADYTAVSGDYTILCDAAGGAIIITLPAASSVTGHIYNVKKIDSTTNTVTLSPSGVDTIDNASTISTEIQWVSIMVQSDGTNWYIL